MAPLISGMAMKRAMMLLATTLWLLPVGCAAAKESTPRTIREWDENRRPVWP